MRILKTAEERFWKLVDKNGELPQHQPELSNCWNWIGAKWKQGYGQFIVEWDGVAKKSLKEAAHRWSFKKYVEDISVDWDVCHKCDNPSCIRPEHLFKGTAKDNIKDMYNKGRQPSVKGVLNPRAKLTEADVIDIRFYYKNSNCSQADLAKRYNVGQAAISDCLPGGRRWKHLDLNKAASQYHQ